MPPYARHGRATAAILASISMLAALGGCGAGRSELPPASACDSSIVLPEHFCAQVFADGLGSIRHIAVGPRGAVYVARWDGAGNPGGLLVLRDTNRDGRADRITHLRNDGGSGLALSSDAVFLSTWSEVLRYPFVDGEGTPRATPDSILISLPKSGHAARSIVLDHAGRLLVNIGAPTNSCQTDDRKRGARGRDPCPELEHFAGIWRFDPRRLRQRPSDGVRVAVGVRHMVALAIHPESGVLYGVQHGRDELYESFPSLYDRAAGEQLPAEEMFALDSARDYGWPYCYYDGAQRRKVLAPEYGGDGKRVGRCASAALPIFAFPAHWAPNGLHFYRGAMFPPRYRAGAFVTFHGGWYRSAPDNGFNVVFLPFDGPRPGSKFELFADGFAGADRHPARARHRPVGIAEAPDGALFITDDKGGRIWRVIYAPPGRR
jgi:glucose/arabinose dehydrogenase